MGSSIDDFYYGTTNLSLGVEGGIPIDPEYNTGKIFEFGRGFYMTQDRELAEQYIIQGIINEFTYKIVEAETNNKKEALKKLADGASGRGNLHIYYIDEILYEELDVKHFESEGEYKTEIEDTIKGYKFNRNYSPNREVTWGPISGKLWDDWWKDKEEIECTETIIDMFADEARKNMEEGKKQVCVHRKKKGEKELIGEYFKPRPIETIKVYRGEKIK